MVEPTDVPESTKLLPCLSCGGKASFFRSLPPGKGCFVECDTCDESTPVYPTEKPAIAAWNQRTPAASPVAPNESTRSLAELLADFVIAHGNKYSPLRDKPEIQAALTVSKEAYETHRVHDFTTAHRESIIAGLANLLPLASPVAGGSVENDPEKCEGGEPCWRNPETGYLEACPKHDAIGMDRKMEVDAARKSVGGSARIAEIASRLAAYRDGEMSQFNFLDAAPDDIAFLLKLVPEGWVKVTPERVAELEWALTSAIDRIKGREYTMDLTLVLRDEMPPSMKQKVRDQIAAKRPPAAEEERSSL